MLKTSQHSVRCLRDFTSLSKEAMELLDGVLAPSAQIRGAVLYTQGEESANVYVLFNGRVKLTAAVTEKRSALLRIAEAGELLGLEDVMSQRPYLATARVLQTSCVGRISRKELVTMIDSYPDLAFAVSERLARDCADALAEVLFLRVIASALQRLAMLILRWSAGGRTRRGIPLLYSQAEIGQMIGASRETVTRLLKQLEVAGDIRVSNSRLKILNRADLERIAQFHTVPQASHSL